MSSPVALADPKDLPKKRFKMTLLQDEFMVTPAGGKRYPAGATLLVDEDTAARWYEHHVADLADPAVETFGEIERRVKREEFFKKARAVEGTFDAAVTRSNSQRERDQLMPPPMPVPPRRGPGRPRRDDLAGAVLSDRMADDEE